MLSVRRRMLINPFAETSVVNVRLMHKSGKIFHGWYECIGFFVPKMEVDVAAPALGSVPLRRCECGERAEMLLQILLSNGIFNWKVPYDWSAEAESPLSDGTNGVASPFNDDSVFFILEKWRKIIISEVNFSNREKINHIFLIEIKSYW